MVNKSKKRKTKKSLKNRQKGGNLASIVAECENILTEKGTNIKNLPVTLTDEESVTYSKLDIDPNNYLKLNIFQYMYYVLPPVP